MRAAWQIFVQNTHVNAQVKSLYELSHIYTLNYAQSACNLTRKKSPCPLHAVAALYSLLCNVHEYDKALGIM